MTEGTTGSTVPRRQLGRHLRELRNQARLTVKVAAEELEWSETKIWRIETGQTSLRSLDVQAMCTIYGAPKELTEALMALAKETKAKGWWVSYGDVLPEAFDVYVGLEEAAKRLRSYEAELVPGLLQTRRYARILIATGYPDVEPAEIDRRVEVRLARQALLTRVTAPPTLEVVVNEAVLCRPVGSREIMAEQLRHLIEMGELPNVTLRVVPFRAGLHHGAMSGPFMLLTFPANSNGEHSEPPTVFKDGFTGDLFLDKPHEIERYEKAFTEMWSTGLNNRNSLTYIEAAAREFD